MMLIPAQVVTSAGVRRECEYRYANCRRRFQWGAALVPLDLYLNVVVGGVLTGLVYGLMALGLSVIFGVVRVVNFAHGEMMTIAMFMAVALWTPHFSSIP